MQLRPPTVPLAPNAIQKGTPLKLLLNQDSIECLAQNILYAHKAFPADEFCKHALSNLEPLELMQRAQHIANSLRQFLPANYTQAVSILIESFTPAEADVGSLGVAGFFYLPHSVFIADYGLDPSYNHGEDPFNVSTQALRELTMRFTAEFAIRPFLIHQPERTLAQVGKWLSDPNPHVRRLCSEGTRPKLPWGKRIQSFVVNPQPTLPILEHLKDDNELYVRRSVANHLGDIAKDHPELVFSICERWLQAGASTDLKWLIRHAVRYHAKKGNARALEIRTKASGKAN
ncbi:DNA alkylation repair protein [Limnobacter parvus]|uniref:DNA alkylation repair protein n=1 Tax=Limnobacter parvus TaxID=2939690 RepID=A0ABT1XJF8_9BURK|nr:DNA alkylation repair protein [Limnobacter parvus]MCR2747435.1 DNA alkylation repair protein [Limnobacter parvus]